MLVKNKNTSINQICTNSNDRMDILLKQIP